MLKNVILLALIAIQLGICLGYSGLIALRAYNKLPPAEVHCVRP